MEVKRIVKSDQEQAIAAWINYLNQLRIIHLCDEIHHLVLFKIIL